MIGKFKAFQVFINKSGNNKFNSNLNNVVNKYSYLYFTDKFDQDFKIIQNFNNSNIIMINHYKDHSIKNDELHFIIGFQKTVLIVKQTLLHKFQPLFSNKSELKICFCKDTKRIFDEIIDIEYEESKKSELFDNEVSQISKEYFNNNAGQFEYNDFLNNIKLCLSGFLIQQSYNDLNYDRVKEFYSESKKEIKIPKEIEENELIELRTIGIGSSFQVVLYYHIYDGKLCAVKKPRANDSLIKKLLKREQYNYTKIKNPFIPKYYGTININGEECLIIEFINGQSLDKVDFSRFSESEKIKIIAQLLSVIQYLHHQKFIYRDMKPDNVMIDQNKTVVVIDFDRMIDEKNIEDANNIQQTINFGLIYHAPEINDKNITNKCDIYSFGMLIKKIIPDLQNNEYYSVINSIYLQCINENITKRPSASYLLSLINSFIQSKNIKIDLSYMINQNDTELQNNLLDVSKTIRYLEHLASQNDPKAQYGLGLFYEDGKYISRDINKAIYYYSLAANQNYLQAQYNLGMIYYKGKYISRDINKAIHYFSLAANQNYPDAQFILGLIYEECEYISLDINKAIHYYSLAANQNYPDAQCNLGLIYYEGQYISQDINKAIYYLTLAANQNDLKAQYNLGLIYYEGQCVSQDINKAIYYLTLAANQDYQEAQNILGLIYYDGQYISQDINKAIYYYTLAANQNDSEAQYNLGLIYYEGQYVSQDINKAIYYYTLAANQSHLKAQFNLGIIYYEGQYISRDINKAILYFTLAANQNDSGAQFYLGWMHYEGQYISLDINKAIYYFTLSAKQNDPNAQYGLGLIYYEGKNISRDINKSIYYYSLAADQNYPQAQFVLGFIYHEGKYISRDINKAIYYYSLAANQSYPKALYNLGLIYYEGQYISQDINKSIYYFTRAANQNYPKAQYNLGFIYYEGQYISRDTNKSIYYFTKAAKQNNPKAQYYLGLIYICDMDIKQDIKKGIYWITQSSNNDYIQAHFALGFLYQEGKYIKRNIEESIKYYKKASSFNHQYAKNNLGIIYKNYVEKKYDYTVYFEEAIRQKNDPVSMFNLSHTYIYEYQDESLINKSIELLIKSSNLGFLPSQELLGLIIITKIFRKQKNKNVKINYKIVERELSEFATETRKLIYQIIDFVQEQLCDLSIFEQYYQQYKDIEFVYNLLEQPVCLKYLYKEENEIKIKDLEENITKDFYEGFGNDIYSK